jgi:PKD repeat protein
MRLHHTFNVRHERTHIWVVNLSGDLPENNNNVSFTANVFDPGADNITLYWDFGDGTNKTTNYPNPNATYQVNIMENVSHVYPLGGNYTVLLTVSDGDGGSTTVYYYLNT